MRGLKQGRALWLVVWLWTGSAHAEKVDQATRTAARALGTAGVELYEAGDYVGANDKLQKAYELMKAPSLGLWSARALVKLGRLVQAAERYFEIASIQVPAGEAVVQKKAQNDAEAELEHLKARIPQIVVQLDGASASEVTVKVDDETLPSPLPPRLVNPGKHTVVAQRGQERVRAEVELAEGRTENVLLKFSATQEAGVLQAEASAGAWNAEAALVGTMMFAPDGTVDVSGCRVILQDATFGDESAFAGGAQLGARWRMSSKWALLLPASVVTNGANTHFGLAGSLRRTFGRFDLGLSVGVRLAMVKPAVSCGGTASVFGDAESIAFFAPTAGVDARLKLANIADEYPIWASLGVAVDLGLIGHGADEFDKSEAGMTGSANVYVQDRITAGPRLLVGASF